MALANIDDSSFAANIAKGVIRSEERYSKSGTKKEIILHPRNELGVVEGRYPRRECDPDVLR
jgi:hypothetical protein